MIKNKIYTMRTNSATNFSENSDWYVKMRRTVVLTLTGNVRAPIAGVEGDTDPNGSYISKETTKILHWIMQAQE